jgi:hypothetical protein
MRTLCAILLTLATAAAIFAPSAGAASFKPCGSVQLDGTGKAKYRAKGVSCRAAKKVLRDASLSLCFDNQIPGWKKEWRAGPGGTKTGLTLKKGAKAIKTNACGS